MSTIKVLRRLIATSPFTLLPIAGKSPARFLASFSRHTPSPSARSSSLEDEISVVYEVGRIVTSTLDIQQVYDEFAAQLKKLVDFKSITVVAVDRIQGTYQTKYAVEEGERTRFDGSILPLQGTRTKLVTDSGETFVQDNAASRPSYANDEWHADHGTVSCIFVPLTGKDGVMGSLNLTSTKSGAFGEREQAILELLANQIAPAVENARLYEESIKLQKAFQESDARYRSLMMQAADPLILSGPDGKIVDVNELACHGLGYTREELLELNLRDFSDVIPGIKGEESQSTVETIHRRKDGTTFPVEVHSSLIELDGLPHRSSIVRDLTEIKCIREEQDRWARESEVMAEIGKIASSSLDISEVYERVGQEINKIVPFHRMNLAVLRPEATSFFVAWVIGGNMDKHSWSAPIPIDGTMAARVLRTRTPVMFEAESDEEVLQEFPGMTRSIGSGLRSFLSAPLISRGNVIAVLQLRSKNPKAYTQRHLGLAVRVADQISGATAASQSFLQQKESEERVKATLLEKEVLLHENSVMAEIGRISSSSLDLSEVYELLGQEVQALIPFQRMTLVLVNAESSTFSRLFSTGSNLYTNRQIGQLPLHGTLSGQVYMTGNPVMRDADDAGNLRREFPGLASGIDEGLKSFLSAPLVSRGNVIAVLQVASTKPHAYSRRHLDLAVRVANQITGAIAAAQLYQHQKESEDRIKASLREKEVLLQEVNHRVKNNLQIISSLLNLQASGIDDDEVLDILQASQGRIRAMATIHDKLYQSENLAQVDFGEYLKSLTDDMRLSYGVNSQQVELKVEAPETLLAVDIAIPCGLIVNELVSNALKYAFPGGREGVIRIGMFTDQRRHKLTVFDNGVGLPPEIEFHESKNLGLRLVNAWVEQLGGRLELRRNGGVGVTIAFSEK